MATNYRIGFGAANTGGSPIFSYFARGDTGSPLTPPTFYELGGGYYGFDFDWTAQPAAVTSVLYVASLNGVEMQGELLAGTVTTPATPYVPPAPGAPLPGQATLGAIRLLAKQRADMVNSPFVTDAEWTSYINGSWARLYGLLLEKWGADYYAPEKYQFTTQGGVETYGLPDGSASFLQPDGVTTARPFFKLLGVDVQAPGTPSGWLPLRPFPMGERDGTGIWGQLSRRPRYRLAKNALWLRPQPQAGLIVQVLYAPRIVALSLDGDVLDGVNGWEEYVVVDAARKALLKEESDTSGVERELADIVARLEHEADSRDAGEPATVADVVYGGGDLPGYGWPY